MFGARIKLDEDTAHQKSTKGKILEWMQSNPKLCKNTNATQIAKSIASSEGGRVNAYRQAICLMINSQMLSRFGNRRRSNFYINYMHKDIPPYVLENAPKESRRMREEAEAGLEENQHLDDIGCIVTEPESEEEAEDTPEEGEDSDIELEEVMEEVMEEVTEIPVVVRNKKENGSMSISITLNLNLN